MQTQSTTGCRFRLVLVVDVEFDTMQKLLIKAAPLITRDGQPRFYVRTLVSLNEAVVDAGGENAKKMNPSTAKAFNAMKQKLKKASKVC
jgi:translation initiation factor 3 subunit C